ncbi:MAG: site-specific DNA-methyltransferase [Anaerolineales bacterium]|nr:site-specific DNA-methyltransferase [Anaerolineales bacterium]
MSTPPSLPLDQVIQGDCLEVLARLPEQSVDLIFADPPYNLQLQADLYRPNMTKVDAVDDAWDKFTSFAEYDGFTRAWLGACRRVLKNAGAIWVIGSYHNIYRIGTALQDLDYWLLNDLAWVKLNPMPNFRGKRFTNAHETLIWAQKLRGERYTFNYKSMKALNDDLQMRSDWHLALCTGKERLKLNGVKAHPTQKPEALLYRVLLASSRPGDVVLDPFFGTGTTGAVAKSLHRHWIGIEREPRYVRLAQARLREVQASMFSDEVYAFDQQAREPRIPFGALLEAGLLVPGQELRFRQQPDLSATVLANGHVRHNGTTGSIHAVGRAIQNAPCNGWEHWYYEDEAGAWQPIDRLRARLRAETEALTPEAGPAAAAAAAMRCAPAAPRPNGARKHNGHKRGGTQPQVR